ncbi:unnamed protein product [Acanthoscelides obtectus]|uniref:Uncharacterized protein n=1 Tax=Acanthoscelides obtectus TaxID=200917 RepID=A0A9P0L3A1_ACAOB|nr:unnamed protein product [Acanthoscelides obtectus]CAK1680837.1 hypothetical protein AOBTE_LOCUS32902 [Acanthoscelides obtectus]
MSPQLRTSVIILTAIVNNVLYTNVPNNVKRIAICFNDEKIDCNQTEWSLMNHKVMNYGQLPVFFKEIPKSKGTFYKIKLIFPDNTEEDSEWYKTTNSDSTAQYDISIILLSIILELNGHQADVSGDYGQVQRTIAAKNYATCEYVI